MSMRRKLFITLLLLELVAMRVGTLNALAKGALNQVQITPGINQKRPTQNQQTIGRRYVWNFQQKNYTVLMEIDIERYNSYSSKERYDIPKLVEEGTEALADLTREFQKMIKENPNWSKQDKVNYVLNFVQSLPYTHDDVTTGYDEFRRYAIETLIEGGGDCEDTTILAGAILRGLGEQVALIRTPAHIALGVSGDFTGSAFVYRGTKYYYCETTGTGWTAGELPKSVGQRATVVPLTASSVPPTPEPAVIETPGTVLPTPPTPTVKPDKPQKPKTPSKREPSTAGAVIAVLFLLFGFGGPLLYFLVRYLRENDEDVGKTYFDDEDDEEFDLSTTSQRDNILEK